MKAPRFHLIVGLTALVVASCASKGVSTCETDSDCDSGFTCLQHQCTKICNSDADCYPDEACTQGLCQAVTAPDCTSDSGCTTPGPCELTEGARCEAGRCWYSAKLPGSLCDDGHLCTDGDTCDANGVCTGILKPCTLPPASECIANDSVYRTWENPGSCQPATGDCVYLPVDQPCTNCDASCLHCAEDEDCIAGSYCNLRDECAQLVGDGGDCSAEGSHACVSHHCDGNLCCAFGDCCNNAIDCPATYATQPICTDPSPNSDCQGTRGFPVCAGHVCETGPADDDSACAGVAHACPDNFAPVVCEASSNQGPPECGTTCGDDGDCASGYVCGASGCVLPAGTGESCSGTGQSSCEDGLKCQNSICCDADGPPCCDAATTCAGGLECNLQAWACFVTCNDADDSRCAVTNTVCLSNECVGKLSDGAVCQNSEQCLSGHCDGRFCCAGGDCCVAPSDCLGGYTLPPVCSDTTSATNCQGTRQDATCENHICGSDVVDDDSGCDGFVHVCANNFADEVCGDSSDQPPADCETVCALSGDCRPGFICDAPNCVVPLVDVVPVYPGNADWNDYVKNDDSGEDAFHQDDVPCDGSEYPGYASCVHGGEVRKVVVSHRSSCTGLTIEDDLDAFDWVCDDNSGAGPVAFFSSGLASAKGLADLLDADGFFENAISVRDASASLIAYSDPAVWSWNNPVLELPDNSNSASLRLDDTDDDGGGPDEAFEEGTLFTVTGHRLSNGVGFDMDRLAVVTLPGGSLTYAGRSDNNCNNDSGSWSSPSYANKRCVVAGADNDFLWVEGTFFGDSTGSRANVIVVLGNMRHSRMQNVTARGSSEWGVSIQDESSQNLLRHIDASDCGGHCMVGVGSDSRVEGLRAVGANTFALTFAGDGNTLVDVVAGDSGDDVLYSGNGDDNTFINLTVFGATGGGDAGGASIYGHRNRFYGVHAYDNSGWGFMLGGDDNVVVGAVVTNNGGSGLRFQCSWREPRDNTAVNVIAANNNSTGVSFGGDSMHSTVSHVTSVGNAGSGISIGRCSTDCVGDSGRYHTVNQALAVNNGEYGVMIGWGGPSDHMVSQLAAVHNGIAGVRLESTSNNIFTGHLLVGGSPSNCLTNAGTATGLYEPDCTESGIDGSSDYPGMLSDAVLSLDVDLTQSFVGKVQSNDTVNASDNLGSQSFGSITDWTHFETEFRYWGREAPAIVDSGLRGRCDGGICRIWDVRLATGDTEVRNFSGALVDGAVCPAAAHGDVAVTDYQAPANTFLVNAVEVLFDASGDDDGLCESGETCIYSPHIGAFQGEGDWSGDRCTFQSGTVSGVDLYGF